MPIQASPPGSLDSPSLEAAEVVSAELPHTLDLTFFYVRPPRGRQGEAAPVAPKPAAGAQPRLLRGGVGVRAAARLSDPCEPSQAKTPPLAPAATPDWPVQPEGDRWSPGPSLSYKGSPRMTAVAKLG